MFWVSVLGLSIGGASALVATEPSTGRVNATQEETLTGEVTALWCLLREDSFGTGPLNNSKQVNCIQLGSPMAIKVGETYYVVETEDRKLKNRLINWAGYRVTIHGKVTQQGAYPLIMVSSAERVYQ